MTAKRNRNAFTLVELLAAIAVVGMLASLVWPSAIRARDAADNARCTSNLRQLGVVIQTATNDNDNRFPEIENDRSAPIHDNADEVMTLPELVLAQGGSVDLLRCPADVRNAGSATGRVTSYYQWKGSSYEWLPFFEGETTANPTIRGPFGTLPVPLSRVRLVTDYAENGEGPHNRGGSGSSTNVLYADGSVRKVVLDGGER